MNDDPIPDPPPCSICGGVWLYGLTHQHRTECERYDHETATIAADHERVSGTREPTETERKIINEHRYSDPGNGDRFLIRYIHTGGLHVRDVLHGTGPGDCERAHRLVGD